MAQEILSPEYLYRRHVDSRLLGLRNNRYSFWVHWRELADYYLPRRYRWLITPNLQSRGAQINQHILDSTGVICARNLAAGMMSGKTSPSRPWFRLMVGKIDNTQTSPASLWLAEVERLMQLVLHESNFYTAMATFYFDLVIFGTASVIIYEDYDTVINCYNPCAGEYYVDLNGQFRPVVFYREFTMTISALVDEFGIENCSEDVRRAYKEGGSALTREVIVAHAIEPNDDDRGFVSKAFKFRECYWQWGGSTSTQNNPIQKPPFLRIKGYYEQFEFTGRWDIVSNDPYGRSPAMDGLGDQKQLQLETKRKAQAIDKMVNPPLVADIQLKNQPASLLPGGMTFVSGYTASGKPGIGSIYDTKFPVSEITEDLAEVRERLRKTFFNDLFQPLSQYETRSNITAVEVDQRKAETLIMLGPVFERLDSEVLAPIIDRVFGIMERAGIIPPAPAEIAGRPIDIDFVSMLNAVQQSLQASSIERVLGLAGNLVGVYPQAMDKIDVDFALDKYSTSLQNDPRLMRSPEATEAIRQQRAQQEQQMAQAEQAEKLAAGAKNLAAADMGSQNLLTSLTAGMAGQ